MTDLNAMRVLLIEDNPGDARLIREMLVQDAAEAYTIHHAETLANGVDAVTGQACDVALLDLTLPDCTGMDTLSTLCAAAPDLPIVVLTGFDDRALGLEALHIGAQDYLVKGETSGPTLQRALRYAIERKRIEAADEAHLATMQALRDSLAALTSTLDLDEVLDRMLNNIDRVIPHHTATVMLVEDDKVRVVRARHHGVSQKVNSTPVRVDDSPMLAAVVRHGETVCVDAQDNPHRGDNGLHETYAHLAAPIQLENQVIGVINVYRDEPFEERDREHMALFAEQAAIAMRNARLFWNTSALAALEERQRLARDLHDSVTQTLFSASVIAESVLRSWGSKPERVEPLIQQLHQLNTGALAEMRVLLLELRPAALENVSIRDLLQQLVLSMHSRKKIEIQLEMDECPNLAFEAKEGLYRITQEALNNVVKHSRATHVDISLRCSAAHDGIDLRICDNGGGFDESARKSTSIGMTIMHERAEAIGAELVIDNQPAHGVTVHAHLPAHAVSGTTTS
jgi:signal transduction histidine kinase